MGRRTGRPRGGHNFIYMAGERVGRLVVQDECERVKDYGVKWLCVCDCGNEKFIRAHELRRADRPTLSCGCLRIEVATVTIAAVNELKRATCIRAFFTTGLYPQGAPKNQ